MDKAGDIVSWIWTMMVAFSLLCGIWNNTAGELAAAALQGAEQAVETVFGLAGSLCLWSGLIHLMEKVGWMDILTRILAPVLKRLFPQGWKDPTVRHALCGNVSANLLGLGNAATPLGISAVCRMAESTRGKASHEMCRLVVLNTASVQLIPTTVAALRSAAGAGTPFDILPAVWVTSVCAVAAGLLVSGLFAVWDK